MKEEDHAKEKNRKHEFEILSGKVARDHVHVFVSYRPNQEISQVVQWLKGISSRILLQESVLAQEVLGSAFLGEGVSGGQFGDNHRRDDPGIN